MPPRRIKPAALLLRRHQVADLYLQSWTQAQIADHLGVSQTTICDDLKQVRKQWRESAVRRLRPGAEEELLKLERIEREAWAAWERSKKPSQAATTSGEPGDQKTRRQMKDRYGDPRFLEQVNKCIASRRALLGLDALGASAGATALEQRPGPASADSAGGHRLTAEPRGSARPSHAGRPDVSRGATWQLIGRTSNSLYSRNWSPAPTPTSCARSKASWCEPVRPCSHS